MDDGTSKVFLCTQGTLDDVSPEVKNFLAFVEGLPVKDAWVDKVKDLIDKLKQDERKKADYMTYQMKIEEERDAAMEEGVVKGEDRLSRLITHLISIGKSDKIASAANDKKIRYALYEEYGIS